jgi:hypothetical protein
MLDACCNVKNERCYKSEEVQEGSVLLNPVHCVVLLFSAAAAMQPSVKQHLLYLVAGL